MTFISLDVLLNDQSLKFDDVWRTHIDGDRNSLYGWEINQILPGGPDTLSNLRPLQWKNNVEKSGGKLLCNVTANGIENVEKD